MGKPTFNFNREYSDWYTNEHCGGRHKTTVADLAAALALLSRDMLVKVSHQYDRHPVGIHDPIYSTSKIAVTIGVGVHGHPIMGSPKEGDITEFIIE